MLSTALELPASGGRDDGGTLVCMVDGAIVGVFLAGNGARSIRSAVVLAGDGDNIIGNLDN